MQITQDDGSITQDDGSTASVSIMSGGLQVLPEPGDQGDQVPRASPPRVAGAGRVEVSRHISCRPFQFPGTSSSIAASSHRARWSTWPFHVALCTVLQTIPCRYSLCVVSALGFVAVDVVALSIIMLMMLSQPTCFLFAGLLMAWTWWTHLDSILPSA